MSNRQFDTEAPTASKPARVQKTAAPGSDITAISDYAPYLHSKWDRGRAPCPEAQAVALVQASGGHLARARRALLQLQRDYGNRYVQRVVNHTRQMTNPTSRPVIQTKLVFGPADDRYEREADQVAREVAGGAASAHGMRASHIQRLASAEGCTVDADLQQAIEGARGGGQPLPEPARASMEQALGVDFSGVRLHTDAQADQLNRALQARAFTTGRDIFLRHGEYDPGCATGQRLLAHELTHVVQQGQGLRYPSRGEVIQRAIGLEYEVQGTELWEQEMAGDQKEKKLTYGTEIYEVQNKYHVESDDGRMEFVTEHFPESIEGVKSLREAVEDAAKFAKLTLQSPRMLGQVAAHHQSGAIKPEFQEKKISFKTASGFEGAGALLAKPQASFGIALQNFDALSKELQEGSLGSADFDLASWRPEKHSQDYEKSIGKDIAKWIEWVEKGFDNNEQKEEAKAWTSFMALIGHYLRQAAKGEWLNAPASDEETTKREKLLAYYGEKLAAPEKLPMVYPKAIHPLMARTNFQMMWQLVQAADAMPTGLDEKWCKGTLLQWTDRKEGDYVYPGGYYDDELDPKLWNTETEEAKNAIVKGPTVGDWFDSIFGGSGAPTMEGRKAPHVPKTPEKRGMGALKKTEPVGTTRTLQAPIFEYRFFEGYYAPDRWGELAEHIGKVVRKINA